MLFYVNILKHVPFHKPRKYGMIASFLKIFIASESRGVTTVVGVSVGKIIMQLIIEAASIQ